MTESTAGITCLKTLLMAFNFIFWVSGIAILALGVWMKLQLHIYLDLTSYSSDNAPYILIGVGAGILVLGTLACICTVKGNACLLYTYAALLIVIFVAELAIGIGCFVMRSKAEEGFSTGLKTAMDNYSSVPNQKKAMDGMQATLKCCGQAGYADWFTRDWSGEGKSSSVPKSCCIDGPDADTCVNTNLPDSNPPGIHAQGCYPLVTEFMQANIGIMAGVAVGFAFLQLFGAVFACCLARAIKKNSYEQVA